MESNRGYCLAGDQGMKQLTKANWKNLQKLWIRKYAHTAVGNKIGLGGHSAISSSNWRQLNLLAS